MDEKRKAFLVICIARTVGAGGSFVGKRLATRLGSRYLDRELLVEAAKRLHKDSDTLEAYDERRLSFWERTRMGYAFGAAEVPYAPPTFQPDDLELFDKEREIMLEAAARGPVVVVGRAGFAVLRDELGLLSVFLNAPVQARAERVRRIYGLATIEEAKSMVLQSDRQREKFIESVTGKGWRDPAHYHLCIDTYRLGTSTTIELVYNAAMEVARKLAGPEEEAF